MQKTAGLALGLGLATIMQYLSQNQLRDMVVFMNICFSTLLESCGISHRVPIDRHHQIHRVSQGALRPGRPRERQGGPRRYARHVRLRLRLQTCGLIREESPGQTTTKTHVRVPLVPSTGKAAEKRKRKKAQQDPICYFCLFICIVYFL